jgi:hypothetical protein
MHRLSVVALAACVSLAAVVGCAGPRAAQPPAAAVQTRAETSHAVRLQASIYEVRVAPEKIAELDAARLATTDLSKLPPELGESRALYLIDQNVSLSGDRVMVGTEEPMVTGSRLTDRGQRLNTVQYNSVGAIVEFKAERIGPRQLQVTSTIEMSTKTDSPVEVSAGFASSVIRKTTMSLKGPVELGKPSVLISADAASRDKDGKAVVYVARLVLGATAGRDR